MGLRSLLYLFNTIDRHYLCINGYDNNIWIVYFSAVLDHCSMPPNIVQEIVNDCNSRTNISQLTIKILIFILFSHYPFPKHLRTMGFTFYTYIHTLTLPYTNILTSHTDIYSFYLSHFQFEVVKSKKGWNTGNKSYCYGSVSYHILWIITHKM